MGNNEWQNQINERKKSCQEEYTKRINALNQDLKQDPNNQYAKEFLRFLKSNQKKILALLDSLSKASQEISYQTRNCTQLREWI